MVGSFAVISSSTHHTSSHGKHKGIYHSLFQKGNETCQAFIWSVWCFESIWREEKGGRFKSGFLIRQSSDTSRARKLCSRGRYNLFSNMNSILIWFMTVWWHLWWLSGNVYTIWLCYTFLICLPIGWLMCFAQQSHRNSWRCFQVMLCTQKAIWHESQQHWILAGKPIQTAGWPELDTLSHFFIRMPWSWWELLESLSIVLWLVSLVRFTGCFLALLVLKQSY